MLQYLLNATAIWAMSLLCFELCFKKETYHGLNRMYLLITLLSGLLIPLWTGPATHAYSVVSNQPLYYQLHHSQQTFERAVNNTGSGSSFSWMSMLAVIYVTGASISILLTAKELIQLFIYYRKGRKQYDGKWLIIETGKEHSPFSLLHMVFISDRNAYSSDQWQIVLQHEQQHSRLGHFADMLLLQLTQILFWFHPLVYVYRRKLLLVHEYQADAASVADLKQYGQFLLEQTMLRPAPLISHSFNYSPIKNRIFMLTRKKPSRRFSGRYLLFFPVLLLSLACSKGKTPDGSSDAGKWKKQGNKATNNGNVIEFSKQETDTVIMTDPATGKQHTSVVVMGEQPLKLNGSRIYSDPETAPVYDGGTNWETALFNTLHEDLNKLGDGKYELGIFSIVIDKEGKLIYYESNGLEQVHMLAPVTAENNGKPVALASSEKVEKVDDVLKQRINDRINSFLNEDKNTRFKPATVNSLPAAAVTHFRYEIKVSGHHAALLN